MGVRLDILQPLTEPLAAFNRHEMTRNNSHEDEDAATVDSETAAPAQRVLLSPESICASALNRMYGWTFLGLMAVPAGWFIHGLFVKYGHYLADFIYGYYLADSIEWTDFVVLTVVLSIIGIIILLLLLFLFYGIAVAAWELIRETYIIEILDRKGDADFVAFIGFFLGFLLTAGLGMLLSHLFRVQIYSDVGIFKFSSAYRTAIYETIVPAFFAITAGLFAFMGLIGRKRDLSKWGPLLILSLLGIPAIALLNYAAGSVPKLWLETLTGLALLMLLTVWRTRRIKRLAQRIVVEAGKQEVPRARVGSPAAQVFAITSATELATIFALLVTIFAYVADARGLL